MYKAMTHGCESIIHTFLVCFILCLAYKTLRNNAILWKGVDCNNCYKKLMYGVWLQKSHLLKMITTNVFKNCKKKPKQTKQKQKQKQK